MTSENSEISVDSPWEEKVKYVIDVMQAALDGKEVQREPLFRHGGDWVRCTEPRFMWDLHDCTFPQYRIKPEESEKKKAVYAIHQVGWEKPLLLSSINLVAEYIKSVAWNPLMISKVEKIVWDGESEFYRAVGDEMHHPKPVTDPAYLRDYDDVVHTAW